MTGKPRSRAFAMAALGILVAAPHMAAARDIMAAPLLGAQPVNVNVSFNIQMPLDSLEEAVIIEAQKQGRALIYRLARNECEVLLKEIADSCRLINLNASTRIPQPRHQNPLFIDLSGNAQFAISLKPEIPE